MGKIILDEEIHHIIGGNGWTKSDFSLEQATLLSTTMIGCVNCLNCSHLEHCNECSFMTHSKYCSKCSLSSNLSDCFECHSCIGLSEEQFKNGTK